MLKADRPRSLGEVVTARLRREIIEGEFVLGQALSESKIASRYQVSRTPVREAFACLGLEGLVRTEPQHGTFVFTMDSEQFTQLSETRSVLETAALRFAVQRNRTALIDEWRRLVAAMTGALRDGDAKTYSSADREFHRVMIDLSDNPFLAAAAQSFSAKMDTVRNRQGSRPDHMKRSYGEHSELLDLVVRDQTDMAVHLLEKHIRDKGESFWADHEAPPKSRWEKISELAE